MSRKFDRFEDDTSVTELKDNKKIDFEDFDLNSSDGASGQIASPNAPRNTGYVPPAAYTTSPPSNRNTYQPPTSPATAPSGGYIPPPIQTLPTSYTMPASNVPQQEEIMFGQANTNVGVEELIPPKPKSPTRIWNIEYYQFLFDVDTRDVVLRVLKSLLPYPNTFFETVGDKPDLWGPIWISTTLIFTLAALGNVTQWVKDSFTDHKKEEWNYDAAKLGIGAAVIYGYLAIIPLCLWGACKWFKIPISWLNLICIYGYSIFIFIPITVVCVVPLLLVHWLSIGIATLISTLFLVFNLIPIFRANVGPGSIMILVIALLHAGLGIFQVYFFVSNGVVIVQDTATSS